MSANPRPRLARVMFVVLALIVTVTVVALVTSSGAAGAAKQPNCGDTITTDTTLRKDLVNCPNNGIIIAADHITLNLNGHRIDGDGTEFGGCDPNGEICDSGVVNDGHDGVTVKHGRVREFGVGVLLGTTTPGRVRHNRLLDISSTRNQFFGFVVASTDRSLVRNVSGSGNVAPDGDGMGLFDAHHVRVLHSLFRHNPGPGIHVGGSTDNLIKGNLFSRDAPAVLIEEADGNRVRRNRVIRGSGGIIVAPGNRNVIRRNRVSRTVDSIAIEKGNGNLVVDNVVLRARITGIRLGVTHPSLGGAKNIVRRNLVKASDGDGFRVYPKDRHSLLQRNIAIGSRDDGFDIEGRLTKLTQNRAMRNGDLGIEAVRGVIDGGGNIAPHNGDSRQCTNIVCN
jgi:parallel beta-helix repeat protein